MWHVCTCFVVDARNVPELQHEAEHWHRFQDQDLTATARNRYMRRWFGIPENLSPRLHPAVASKGKVVQHLWRVKSLPARRQDKGHAVYDSLNTY